MITGVRAYIEGNPYTMFIFGHEPESNFFFILFFAMCPQPFFFLRYFFFTLSLRQIFFLLVVPNQVKRDLQFC
jgi:hypothetical protein